MIVQKIIGPQPFPQDSPESERNYLKKKKNLFLNAVKLLICIRSIILAHVMARYLIDRTYSSQNGTEKEQTETNEGSSINNATA